MQAWHIWFFIATILFIAEIFTPEFFLTCIGISALVAGIVDLFGGSIVLQFLFFSITMLIVLVTLRPILIRFFKTRRKSFATNCEALIGKSATVEETIDNNKQRGRVKVGAESWRGVSISVPVIPIGTVVKVLDVDGNKLVVGPIINKEG